MDLSRPTTRAPLSLDDDDFKPCAAARSDELAAPLAGARFGQRDVRAAGQDAMLKRFLKFFKQREALEVPEFEGS